MPKSNTGAFYSCILQTVYNSLWFVVIFCIRDRSNTGRCLQAKPLVKVDSVLVKGSKLLSHAGTLMGLGPKWKTHLSGSIFVDEAEKQPFFLLAEKKISQPHIYSWAGLKETQYIFFSEVLTAVSQTSRWECFMTRTVGRLKNSITGFPLSPSNLSPLDAIPRQSVTSKESQLNRSYLSSWPRCRDNRLPPSLVLDLYHVWWWPLKIKACLLTNSETPTESKIVTGTDCKTETEIFKLIWIGPLFAFSLLMASNGF